MTEEDILNRGQHRLGLLAHRRQIAANAPKALRSLGAANVEALRAARLKGFAGALVTKWEP